MAIQTINLTVPGGDTPRSAFTKLNANFSDQSNAASRLVGNIGGGLPEFSPNAGVGGFGLGAESPMYGSGTTNPLSAISGTGWHSLYSKPTDTPRANPDTYLRGVVYHHVRAGSNTQQGVTAHQFLVDFETSTKHTIYSRHIDVGNPNAWEKMYTSGNTTLDGNGALKPSSPVLRVFNDHIEGNADGDAMAAMYTKNGVGDYTITGTTGLRTDGWYIVIPNDMNGNPKVAVTLDDTDGVITLRSYVRIFDMTTFKFVPDLDQPLDIPDSRWIDLRFNDLPIDDVPAQ